MSEVTEAFAGLRAKFCEFGSFVGSLLTPAFRTLAGTDTTRREKPHAGRQTPRRRGIR
jgi:hypothetical protein